MHIQNHLKWSEKYMKVNCSKVLLMAKTHVTLDGFDGWGKGWNVNG